MLANSDPESLQVALQNISVPAPIVSLFSLRVLDGCEPSVESCQLLNGLWIAYVTETNRSMVVDGRSSRWTYRYR